MIPVVCRVKHDPEAGTYGDCIRACVASVLEFDALQVPHFAHDNPDGETLNQRIRDYLNTLNLAPFWSHYDGSATLHDILSHQNAINPTTVYMLFGATELGDHVIVCKGGAVVHDPAWYRSPLVKCGSHEFWSIMVICRL